jgi:hypothetical protein
MQEGGPRDNGIGPARGSAIGAFLILRSRPATPVPRRRFRTMDSDRRQGDAGIRSCRSSTSGVVPSRRAEVRRAATIRVDKRHHGPRSVDRDRPRRHTHGRAVRRPRSPCIAARPPSSGSSSSGRRRDNTLGAEGAGASDRSTCLHAPDRPGIGAPAGGPFTARSAKTHETSNGSTVRADPMLGPRGVRRDRAR